MKKTFIRLGGEPVGGPRCYRIVRHYKDSFSKRTIKSRLSLAEAQNHCSREDTRGPGWFDGYDYMKGCRP